MGAHVSTIQSTVKERFQICDQEGKGYLVRQSLHQGLRQWMQVHLSQQLTCALIANRCMCTQTLGQMMAMQPQFGVSSCHLGVLFMIDRYVC
jgi:hypothetical protein